MRSWLRWDRTNRRCRLFACVPFSGREADRQIWRLGNSGFRDTSPHGLRGRTALQAIERVLWRHEPHDPGQTAKFSNQKDLHCLSRHLRCSAGDCRARGLRAGSGDATQRFYSACCIFAGCAQAPAARVNARDYCESRVARPDGFSCRAQSAGAQGQGLPSAVHTFSAFWL